MGFSLKLVLFTFFFAVQQICNVEMIMNTPTNWATNPCPRNPIGSCINNPFSLKNEPHNYFAQPINLFYRQQHDPDGNYTRYCFTDSKGHQSPTLLVDHGRSLNLELTNSMNGSITMSHVSCSNMSFTLQAVNIHFHGAAVSPKCKDKKLKRGDDVLTTVINEGRTASYDLDFSKEQSPGLYGYHTHMYKYTNPTMLGGASGAFIIEGIECVQPRVQGLEERIIELRSNQLPASTSNLTNAPSYDISINYVPVPFPNYEPACITMCPGKEQFWRIVNLCADTPMNLQVMYDGVAQKMEAVALDGTVLGLSRNRITTITKTSLFMAPLTRHEIIVPSPLSTVKLALLRTLEVDQGHGSNPERNIARIYLTNNPIGLRVIPKCNNTRILKNVLAVPSLLEAIPVAQRELYFSEDFTTGQPLFFITVNGAKPRVFNSSDPPAITASHNTVEDWTIENRSTGSHMFHIHQLDYMVMKKNGVPVCFKDMQLRDVIQVDAWSGNKTDPYTNVVLRMDFRRENLKDSTFVYHCHYVDHEDGGMMAKIYIK